ncbi:LysR family transcriptional regulator [Stutzerimonas zhaodongensis]|uniref:LysR family transcriptional regulator n=1 Tax=Stutzerimonas zhaodongensis TaxID=1176257 RepID=A0A3M2HL95_9GAMM|nr:LysR family transcriptional regulator [Stutzerimonas zhaodongensis]MCQ2028931.1 LysR family transcriptional regulator [Stutzerimonas zhaodongensis]MCQ4316082.1 LysR family transcriptional regulator [Stutzerimonas zhaodongensis]RMH89115.1 LysR family transcriptional regulator [Stutzerimonas zhaodongensis]
MRKPNLTDVSIFAAVVEAGGFRAAAQKRGLSASSLSDCIRRLESDLGLRLLNRTTRSVTPTAAGERLLERLRPALLEIDAAFNDLDDEAQRPVGTLKLNVPVPVARFMLPDLLARFLRLYPGVNVEVVMENTFIDVTAGGYDAGVRYEESLAKDMIAVPIGPRRQRFVAAAAPRYLAERGTPNEPAELLGHELLGHRFESGKVGVFEFEKDGRVVRVPPQGQMLTSSHDLKIRSAINGLGIVYTFEDFVREPLSDGRLVPILEDWWQAFDGPYLYYHGRRHMPSPLRAFIDFLKAETDMSPGIQ